MKKLASIIIFALLFAGCHKDNCECGEVKSYTIQDSIQTVYVQNYCSGNIIEIKNVIEGMKNIPVTFNNSMYRINSIYCLDHEW
jgi:PBP1b-binding outer membrane lipoprotein LpoB